MKITVIAPVHEDCRKLLEKNAEVIYGGWALTDPVVTPLPSDEEILLLSRRAQAIIVPGELSAYVIQNCPELKVIGVARGEPRGVDLQAATSHGIPVVYAAGRNAIAVADYTLAAILMLCRQIIQAQEFVRLRHWRTWDDLFATPLLDGFELNRKVLGLIGFGYIGREVARRAQAFGMRIMVYDPYISKEDLASYAVEKVDLAELLSISDIVSLHCKVTEETRGLIGRDELQLMKPGSFLVNTARAAIIDQQALLEALRSDHLAGAALDVYWEEPLPLDSPFLELQQVILTPHIGGITSEVELRTSEIVVEDVLTVLRGERPQRIANPEVYADR